MAREYFSKYLMNNLQGKEGESIRPNASLDQCVMGYVVNLAPLRTAMSACQPVMTMPAELASGMEELIQVSLDPLPRSKLRIARTALSPHEVLAFIDRIGFDMFDDHWIKQASDVGVALDFRFPVTNVSKSGSSTAVLGHDLYNDIYSYDFNRLSDEFHDRATYTGIDVDHDTCPCVACSPIAPSGHLIHSKLQIEQFPDKSTGNHYQSAHTRAYIHHLLHTHEMSAHALLTAHNLAVFDAFFAGIRRVLGQVNGAETFRREIAIFADHYADPASLLEDSRRHWATVETARGKGRMARERAKEIVEDNLAALPPLDLTIKASPTPLH